MTRLEKLKGALITAENLHALHLKQASTSFELVVACRREVAAELRDALGDPSRDLAHIVRDFMLSQQQMDEGSVISPYNRTLTEIKRKLAEAKAKPGHYCATCGRVNSIVNECRCDPNNLPTSPSQP